MATAVGEAGEGPRAALCAALSAAVRGCAAIGTAAGDALDLLCAARSTAERGPATSAAFVTPQVSAATDAPQPDCGPGPADICVIVARGVTMGRGSTTAGICARSKSIQPWNVKICERSFCLDGGYNERPSVLRRKKTKRKGKTPSP